MAIGKRMGYDIKVDYSNSVANTTAVTKALDELYRKINEIKKNSNLKIELKGLPRTIDSTTTKVATLANAVDRLKTNTQSVTNTFGTLSDKLKSIRTDTDAMTKGMTDSAKAVDQLHKASQNTRTNYRNQSTTTQIGSLKNQADVLYQAWRNGNIAQAEYNSKMTELQSKLSTLYGYQRNIRDLTKEKVSLMQKWGVELESVQHRMGYLATRFAALWVGDKLMGSLAALPKVEQDMAGFAQVMKHGTGETNAFAKSLLEVDPSNMKNALQLSGNEAEHFKHELGEMQGKLQDLAVKYGTTSHEMIESAKLWGRAYKDNNTVLALTDAATKLAVADAFDIVSANKALESSIMQWGFQIRNTNDAMTVSNRIIDSWTALAHNYTVSAQTLSEANKRMAQSAAEVGVGFHTAQALVSVMARKTQAEGGEIGNALKSIFGSIHSKKAITELENFGIAVYQVSETGQREFRKVDDVLLDLMIKADGSKQSLEGLLKAISGGKWQWNKADAMLDLREYLDALRISSSSFGFTDAQVGMQLDTIQTKMKQIAAEWERVMTSNGNVANGFKTILDLVLKMLKWFDQLPSGVFLYTAAMTTLIFTYHKFQGVQDQVRASISKAWQSATVAVNNYTAAVKASYMQTGGMRGAFSATGTAISKLGKGIQAATAFMGGWIGIVLTAITVAYSWWEASLNQSKAIVEENESHAKLLQQYQETYQRLSEAINISSQYITVIDSLKQKINEANAAKQDSSKYDEEMKTAKQGLIDILGEENTTWILQGETVEEQNSRMQEAVKRRQEDLEKKMAAEREELRKARKAVADMADENIRSLKNERTGWYERFKLIAHYIGLIEAAKDAWINFQAAISETNLEKMESDYAKSNIEYNEQNDKLEQLKREGASSLEIAVQEAKVNQYKAKNDLAQAEYRHNKAMVDEARRNKERIDQMTEVKARVEMGDNIRSLSVGEDSDKINPMENTTGNYQRNELDDDDDGSSKGKKGKTKKEKEPDTSAILDAANEQLGKAYSLGADGTWATDCGKLVADATLQAYGVQIPRYVPDIMKKAMDAGAWHDAGDGYVPRAGDGVVVLGDEHIVISDGKGGYTGANSSTGVVAKESVETDFGQATGYVDMAKMLGITSKSDSRTLSAKAKKEANRAKKAEELEQKLNAKMEEMEAAILPKEQAELAKKTNDLNKKVHEITKDMNELIKLNPKADVSKLQDTLNRYEEVMRHRLQDEEAIKGFDKASDHLKDNQTASDLEYEDKNENFWVTDRREAQFLKLQRDIQAARVEYMKEALDRGDSNFSIDDIRKAEIELKKFDNQLNKVANTLKNDVKKQAHDVFHSLIFEGQSIKDIWKNLWKQLAEDALKMIIGINDGKGGLLQNLLKLGNKSYMKDITGQSDDKENIGGIDSQLNQQMITNQRLQEMNSGWQQWLQQTNNGTNFTTATFTDAVIYSNGKGVDDINLPEGNKDGEKKDDVSQYINAGMKIAGGGNSGWGKTMGTIGTIASFAKQFGLLKFASGGSVDKDQLVRVGEGDKKEWIIPTSDKARGRQLLGQAAKDLDIGFTSGIEPKWQHEDTYKGALAEQTKRQDKMMSRMMANSEAMTKGMTFMANNGSGTKESIAQPVFMKQTMSDQDFLAKYNKLVNLGKLRQA